MRVGWQQGARDPARAASVPTPALLRAAHPALQMQRTLGNEAVRALFESGRVRAKLRVGPPDDAYEREADRVADRVMTMRDPALSVDGEVAAAPPSVQRKCTACLEDEEEELQRKPAPYARVDAEEQAQDPLVPRGGGAPLHARQLDFFEPRFGHDFSRVRVHTDDRAAAAARSLGALAYTVGPNVVVDAGARDIDSGAGRHLLAHELTHVIQQGHAPPSTRGGAVRSPPAGEAVMPYRPKDSANFRVCDGGGLTEASFKAKDKDKVAWIEKIAITFDGTATDSDNDVIPTGTLVADYFDNPAKETQISVAIVGGKASEGLTDQGNHKVTRIEGCGYHHTSVLPKSERIKGHKRAFKYFADTSKASMSFAVFFVEGKATGNQAIHEGLLTTGSLACVHVGDSDIIRQINYHSVEGRTKVKVSYGATALEKVCCERFAVKGRMVSNPCKGQDETKC